MFLLRVVSLYFHCCESEFDDHEHRARLFFLSKMALFVFACPLHLLFVDERERERDCIETTERQHMDRKGLWKTITKNTIDAHGMA